MHHIVPNEGCDLHYWQRGTGRPVVFVHGAGCDHTVFAEQFEAVTRAGYRAVSWDLRLHGLSRPATQPINADSLVGDLQAVIADLAETHRPVLVGHSLGSAVVQDYARIHPGRYKGLVSIGGSFNQGPQPLANRLMQRLTALSVRAAPSRALLHLASRTGAFRPENQAVLARTMAALEPAELRAAMLAGNGFSAPDAHYRCAMPVCLVRGVNDKVGEQLSNVSVWAERQGVAEHVLAGAGHAAQLDNPAGFNHILLEFLDGL